MNFFRNKKKATENEFDNFPPIGGLMVSKMVTDKNIKPRFMYREKRTRPEDSGWRIFTGFESEEYTDNPENTGIYNPSTILKIDSSIKDILLKGVGSVYEKKEDDGDWYRVLDFELEDDYMVIHKLTDKLTIEINNLFERSVEESEDLLYTTGDKSVRLAIWNSPEKTRKELYIEYMLMIKERSQSSGQTLKTFDFSDEKVARLGYLTREDDGDKNYNVVYGTSIIGGQIIESALCFDEDDDLEWAIDTWKSIKPE